MRRKDGKLKVNSGRKLTVECQQAVKALEALKCLRENVEDERAFVSSSISNRLKSIFRERNRKSKSCHKCCLSLNLPLELDNGDIDELVNLIDTDHLLRNNSYFFPDPFININLAGNLKDAIDCLPSSLRKLCEELKANPPATLSGAGKRTVNASTVNSGKSGKS